MKRTRRTLPGTLAPGDAYAPSLFPEEHPAPAAPLALFDVDTGRLDIDRTGIAPAAPCAVCTSPDHLTAGCPKGIAGELFEADDHRHQDDPEADAGRRWADELTPGQVVNARNLALIELAEAGPSPFLRRRAAEALDAIDRGDEEEAARIVAIITAQEAAPEVPAAVEPDNTPEAVEARRQMFEF